MNKEDFNKVWSESSRENILNQYYYDYIYMQQLKQALVNIEHYLDSKQFYLLMEEPQISINSTPSKYEMIRSDISSIIDKVIGDENG